MSNCLSIRSCENKLQSLRNSFIVFLLPMYFLTRSKKASSSCVGLVVLVGGKGSGRAGVKVGETGGPSGTKGCFVPWPVFARFKDPSASLSTSRLSSHSRRLFCSAEDEDPFD